MLRLRKLPKIRTHLGRIAIRAAAREDALISSPRGDLTSFLTIRFPVKRIVQLIRLEDGAVIDRARMPDGFCPAYFARVASWREKYSPEQYLIRFRPQIKLQIDLFKYEYEEHTNG